MGSTHRLVVGGSVQLALEALERERFEQDRTTGLKPAAAMLLPLVLCLARLAARADAKEASQ